MSCGVSGERGVALDLDGVLIDGMPFHVDAWKAALGPHGLSIDENELYELEGIPTADVLDILAKRHDFSLSEAERAEIVARKRARYGEIFSPRPLAGAKDLVELLDRFGYRLALVTGTQRASGERALEELDVRERFVRIVSVEDVSAGKPAPEPYLKALATLAVPPENCLVIENAPPGVASARAAGLACVALATYLPAERLRELPGVGAVFETLAELTVWLQEEAGRSKARGPFAFSQAERSL
jgi:beta-phosphoglucomutase